MHILLLYKILMKKYLNKLEYRSWHRGTKEADLFLGKFFDKYKGKLKKKTYLIMKILDAVNDDKIMLIIKNKYEWPKDISKEIIDLLEDYIK